MSSVPPDPHVPTRRVLAFESRRAVETAELLRRHGAEPLSAPSMREVELDRPDDLFAYLRALEEGRIDVVVLLTGVGLRHLVRRVASEFPPERVAAALRRATLVARGPKPVAALRELGMRPDLVVPEPNTWRELLATLDERLPVRDRHVAVQEYGITNPSLIEGLTERGALVHRVPIYRWDLPEDVEPLRRGLAALRAGEVDGVLFTSANQVFSVFSFHAAARGGDAAEAEEELRQALRAVVVGSVGPVCSEALRQHGVEPDFEARPPKLGPLVAGLVQRLREHRSPPPPSTADSGS